MEVKKATTSKELNSLLVVSIAVENQVPSKFVT